MIIIFDGDGDSDDLNVDHNGDDDGGGDHINVEDITFQKKKTLKRANQNKMVFKSLPVVMSLEESEPQVEFKHDTT